jgi:hypothetical protein
LSACQDRAMRHERELYANGTNFVRIEIARATRQPKRKVSAAVR